MISTINFKSFSIIFSLNQIITSVRMPITFFFFFFIYRLCWSTIALIDDVCLLNCLIFVYRKLKEEAWIFFFLIFLMFMLMDCSDCVLNMLTHKYFEVKLSLMNRKYFVYKLKCSLKSLNLFESTLNLNGYGCIAHYVCYF